MKRGAIDHPKMRRLAKAMGKPTYAALGLMEAIIHWSAKYAPCGNVGKYADIEIEEAIGWDDAEGTMVPILIDAGFLEFHPDHRVVIHDWFDHADDSVHMALARAGEVFWCGRVPKMTRLSKHERERIEATYAERTAMHQAARTSTRTENAQQTHGTRTENALPCLPLPSPALPSPPLPCDGHSTLDGGPSFLDFWYAYPAHRRKRQGDAIAVWTELRREGIDPAAIMAGVTAYAASDVGKGKFTLEPANWLNGRCWLDDPLSWADEPNKTDKNEADRKAKAERIARMVEERR